MIPDEYPALLEALSHLGVWRMRRLVGDPIGDATAAFRSDAMSSSAGWAGGDWAGRTEKRGYVVTPIDVWRRHLDADVAAGSPPGRELRDGDVLVTWREIVGAVRDGWRAEYTDLYDHAMVAHDRLELACEKYGGAPIDWPRGVDDYYRLRGRLGAVDEWIKEQVMLNVCAADPVFADEQLALL